MINQIRRKFLHNPATSNYNLSSPLKKGIFNWYQAMAEGGLKMRIFIFLLKILPLVRQQPFCAIWKKRYLKYNASTQFTFIEVSQFGHFYFMTIIQNKDGFFIEAGALDGEHLSNTLYMERFLNWTGILIEADPKSYDNLLKRNRKSVNT